MEPQQRSHPTPFPSYDPYATHPHDNIRAWLDGVVMDEEHKPLVTDVLHALSGLQHPSETHKTEQPRPKVTVRTIGPGFMGRAPPFASTEFFANIVVVAILLLFAPGFTLLAAGVFFTSRVAERVARTMPHTGDANMVSNEQPDYFQASHSESSESSATATVDDMYRQIEDLARQVTNASRPHSLHVQDDVLNPPKDSPLNPNSAYFDTVAWTKAFISLYESDPSSTPGRLTGVAFKNLNVFGYSTGTQYQKSAGNIALSIASDLVGLATGRTQSRIDILRDFEGLVEPGEMLLALGPPGSGCSTLLKTLAGQTEGLNVSKDSYMNFRGIDPRYMHDWFRGDVLYNAEVDVHLAPLTVGDTLEFASRARVPATIPAGLISKQYARIMRDVLMASFGITHTLNTKVGDDYVRGVSGGERKRVSIVEAALTGAKFQCWDNSTRGLDSGNAIAFCQNLRTQADLLDVAAVVAIYQAPQSAYDLFDKVTVLYEGRQIYFGKIDQAKQYFENMGFMCPDRQTTPDFLTSMTSPSERRIRPGYEDQAPRTADDFAARWKDSREHSALMSDISAYEKAHPAKVRLEEFQQSIKAERSSFQRLKSPYMITYPRQVKLCLWRGWKRLVADPGFTISSLVFNIIVGFVLGSMFFNLKADSSTFYYRGGLIFFALLFNAFASEMEVLTLYAQRPVVEKHNRYALYHQSAEAISSFILELPYKITNVFTFNSILYFMANLKREPGPFFFFCLVSFAVLLAMSGIYRTMASLARTSHQAMVPVTLVTIGVMMYAGFTVPTSYMQGWSRWMGYINPLSYAFEALMANEFHGRTFQCSGLVPSGSVYGDLPISGRTCAVVGAVLGSDLVDGDRYIEQSFGYFNSHKWRNVGILCGYIVFFFITYIVAAEFAKPPKSEGEVLVFRRGKMPAGLAEKARSDEEHQTREIAVTEKVHSLPVEKRPSNERPRPSACGKPIFHWEDICYDVKIKGQDRRILDHIDGWVQPGVITALMGASGAGKTTLLDALATRVTMGILSGDTMVNGQPTDKSFPHRVGYVQQQDVHMDTMTVREALQFSALLRQSAEIPRSEKLEYIDEVIDLLDMGDFVDAVIGVPGQGLNVEQRKRLTIGVELAARPQLLVFLDEPTSGLDSQTSWAICDLIEKLAKSGQAVLCTIHQPSAMLFSRFDRLLLLQRGGKTVYFGDIGTNARTMIDYLERNGAPPCPVDGNPAEWMLKVTTLSDDGPNWFDIWRSSPEYHDVKDELGLLRQLSTGQGSGNDSASHHEFVASFWTQFVQVFSRTAKHFWRSPVYIWSKLTLTVLLALYIGFTFKSDNSLQGLQNQLYAFFMCLTTVNEFSKQVMPMFIPQRALYEVRERPSRVYRWTTYLLSNVVVEMIWNTIAAVIFFFCWYYPARFFRNTTPDDVNIRGFTVFLFIWIFFLWTSTFSQLAIVAIETADLASIPASLFAILCMSFCGIGVIRADLPAIWSDLMYYVSPMTYLVSGALSTCLHGSKVVCTAKEIVQVPVPSNMTCGEFLGPFVQGAGGYLVDAAATDMCGYCRMATTDDFLAHFEIKYDDRWRNFGLLWVYVGFNIIAACGLYWLARVPKGQGVRRK
ncbi:ABC transporter [Colletotrichum karsti]|uniref:ABC transporter n=1 Tax=Colletotrichum karsti TaxID=1095194 RepID=A0A9P6IAI7_9PEZI|nr:ABC transporter [Colletotrichum karsti]KAF9875065.1 ABC transporter [Colletotrichum karsti]